jgi:predicted nucleotidyltransferase
MKQRSVHHVKAQLDEIALRLFGNTPVLFGYLYGSYAGGVPHRFSDLDIAVFVREIDPAACLELELTLSLRIDKALDHAAQSEVRIINHLPLVVKGRILTDGVIIYCVDEAARVDFECGVRRAYFDFLPVLQFHDKSFRRQVRDGLR